MWAVVMHVSLLRLKLRIWQLKTWFHKKTGKYLISYVTIYFPNRVRFMLLFVCVRVCVWHSYVRDTHAWIETVCPRKIFGVSDQVGSRNNITGLYNTVTSIESLPEHHFQRIFQDFMQSFPGKCWNKLSFHSPPKAC